MGREPHCSMGLPRKQFVLLSRLIPQEGSDGRSCDGENRKGVRDGGRRTILSCATGLTVRFLCNRSPLSRRRP